MNYFFRMRAKRGLLLAPRIAGLAKTRAIRKEAPQEQRTSPACRSRTTLDRCAQPLEYCRQMVDECCDSVNPSQLRVV